MGTSKAHSSPQGSTPNSSKRLPEELKSNLGFAIAHGTYMDEEAREAQFERLCEEIQRYATTLAEETSIQAKQDVLKDLLDWYEMYNKPGFNWYGAVKAMQVMKDLRKPFVELAPQKESDTHE